MKYCTGCETYKQLNIQNFYSETRRKDGFSFYCKECVSNRRKKRNWEKRNQGQYPLGYKVCNSCKEEKKATSENFYKHKHTHNGLLSSCKICTLKNTQKRRVTPEGKADISKYNKKKQKLNKLNNKERNPYEVGGDKFCPQCTTRKPITDFYRNRTRPSGLKSICKDCSKKRIYDYRKENPEKARLTQKKAVTRWKATNSDRVKSLRDLYNNRRRVLELKLPDTFTIQQWEYALDYFNGCCAVCERQMNDMFGDFKSSQDHWIPISYKGDDNPGNVAENIVPLCHGKDGCNNKKHAKLPKEWLVETYGGEKAKKILNRIDTYFTHVKGRNKTD